MTRLLKECRCSMNKHPSNYDRVKRFVENELHIKLTFYQDMTLKYMFDEEVQKQLKQIYENE